MERVQHYANMDTRKHLEAGVAGERYKPVCSVYRASEKELKLLKEDGEDWCSEIISTVKKLEDDQSTVRRKKRKKKKKKKVFLYS